MNLELIEKELSPLIQKLGYELASIAVRKEKGEIILGIALDRIESIDMNAISSASLEISRFLDEKDLVEEKYVLDVYSLGIEKPLAIDKLHLYVGKYVNIHLKNPIKGQNFIEGIIQRVEGDKLTIDYKIKTRKIQIDLDLANIVKARLAVKF